MYLYYMCDVSLFRNSHHFLEISDVRKKWADPLLLPRETFTHVLAFLRRSVLK